MGGDRVEVRWQAGLFDAAVTKVHASGSVDVKYDSDGSAGISLTAEAHGLTLLGDEEKKGGGGKKKKVCLVDGCPNSLFQGANAKHGSKPCSADGCSTKARARGLCYNHGALGECLREGCTTPAVKKGRLCFKHTVKLSCADPDCDTPQILGSLSASSTTPMDTAPWTRASATPSRLEGSAEKRQQDSGVLYRRLQQHC